MRVNVNNQTAIKHSVQYSSNYFVIGECGYEKVPDRCFFYSTPKTVAYFSPITYVSTSLIFFSPVFPSK